MNIKDSSDFAVKLIEEATEVFGSNAAAEMWLNELHPLLGKSPYEYAESIEGKQEVLKILSALKYGGVV